ncbi:hypothetical protein SAMN02745218_01805 [Desulfofundulus australicus DSM 11792]|uniref:Uncharacterized protein n=1 Tax=Desulfofundulus australicus DSM 11792 TaxID=1121425 RepID=A0A1M5A6T9_9FIRM|nr:hypothetical protein SAMN02745218_01805 [Desulfofundulus australicus DSM 11792]
MGKQSESLQKRLKPLIIVITLPAPRRRIAVANGMHGIFDNVHFKAMKALSASSKRGVGFHGFCVLLL